MHMRLEVCVFYNKFNLHATTTANTWLTWKKYQDVKCVFSISLKKRYKF